MLSLTSWLPLESLLAFILPGYIGHTISVFLVPWLPWKIFSTPVSIQILLPQPGYLALQSIYGNIFPTTYTTVNIFHYAIDVSSHKVDLIRKGKLLNRIKYLLENTDREIACQADSREPGD